MNSHAINESTLAPTQRKAQRISIAVKPGPERENFINNSKAIFSLSPFGNAPRPPSIKVPPVTSRRHSKGA